MGSSGSSSGSGRGLEMDLEIWIRTHEGVKFKMIRRRPRAARTSSCGVVVVTFP